MSEAELGNIIFPLTLLLALILSAIVGVILFIKNR